METVSPNLYVKDLQETISFYQILGFQVITVVPDNSNPVFALMMNGGVTFMFSNFCKY